MKLNRIKAVLAEKGISQTWLAKQLGKSFSMVNAYACNRIQPNLETLQQIAVILQVDLKDLITDKEKMMYYPAAQKNHHAQKSGLLYHLKRMIMTGDAICNVYTNLNRDLVAAGVLLHDIEKLNEIMADELGIASGYSFEGQLLGHIIQGIKLVDRLGEELGISREKTIMLEHMILSHHYEPEFGSPKKPLFPEAEILHYLDMMDARMFDMEEALSGAEPGDFSERVWTLDNRRLYKSSDIQE